MSSLVSKAFPCLVLQCHKTRSLSRNRQLARQLLLEKLDVLYNGKESIIAKEIAKKRKLKANYARKRRIKESIDPVGARVISEADNADK